MRRSGAIGRAGLLALACAAAGAGLGIGPGAGRAEAEDAGMQVLAAPGFEAAGPGFAGAGLAGVVPLRKDGLWGLMARDGTWAAEPQYQAIGTPGLGRLPVEKDNLWGVVDAGGKVVTPFAFQAIGQIADWTPMRWKGQWWAVGPDGRPEGQPLPFDALIGNDGTCMVGKAGGVPIAVNRGTPFAATMLKPEDDMRAPSEGLVPVVQDGREGHLDCAYGMILGGGADAVAVRGFHEGWAGVKGPEGWGFASVFGSAAEIGGTWEDVGDFSEGLAAAQSGGLWGFVGQTGAWVIPPRFQAVGMFQGGMAPARADGRWGFIGRGGGWLIAPRFDAVMAPSQGMAAVLSGDRWGVVAVPALAIAADGLSSAVPAGWRRLVGAAGCAADYALPPGTPILDSPGAGAPREIVPEGTARPVCLGTARDGHVAVQAADGAPLGWVAADLPLALR